MAAPHVPTVDDIPFSREVITIDSSASVIDAFKTLVANKILSAPVRDAATGDFIGFFDVSDFAQFVVDAIEHNAEAPIEFSDLQELLNVITTIHPKTLDSVLALKGKGDFNTVAPGTSLKTVFELLSAGAHRVPVVDADGKIIKIVSQSALTKYIVTHANTGLLKACGEKTVAESGLGSRKVVTASQNLSAVQAIKLLLANQISGMVVVDEIGKAVTSVSLSDLRTAVAGPPFMFNGINVLELVQHSRALDGSQERPAIIQVHPDTKLTQVVSRLAATGLHRVYVTDSKGVPVGVISLKDLLRYVYHATTD